MLNKNIHVRATLQKYNKPVLSLDAFYVVIFISASRDVQIFTSISLQIGSVAQSINKLVEPVCGDVEGSPIRGSVNAVFRNERFSVQTNKCLVGLEGADIH